MGGMVDGQQLLTCKYSLHLPVNPAECKVLRG